MHFRLTSDENEGSGVGEIVDELSGPARRFFSEKDYGAGLLGIVVILMCRDSDLKFERRLRFSQTERKLFMDVMLDFDHMRLATPALRKAIISDRLLREIPEVVHQYPIREFDESRFITDLKGWLAGNGIVVPHTSGSEVR